MAKRLTDAERKAIVAAYVECGNYSAVARQFGVSHPCVRGVVEAAAPESYEKFRRKKEENTALVLAHMDARKKDVCELIDLLLAAIKDPEKIKVTPLSQIATTMGILIDKYTANELSKAAEGQETSLADAIRAAYEKRVADGGDDDV